MFQEALMPPEHILFILVFMQNYISLSLLQGNLSLLATVET